MFRAKYGELTESRVKGKGYSLLVAASRTENVFVYLDLLVRGAFKNVCLNGCV